MWGASLFHNCVKVVKKIEPGGKETGSAFGAGFFVL